MYSPFRMFMHDAMRMLRKIIVKIIAMVLFIILFAFNLVMKLIAFARGLVIPVIGGTVFLMGLFTYIEFKDLLRPDMILYYVIGIALIGLYYSLPYLVELFEDYVLSELKLRAFAPLVVRSRLKFTM